MPDISDVTDKLAELIAQAVYPNSYPAPPSPGRTPDTQTGERVRASGG